MKDTPLLMRADMVRYTLADIKSETRRLSRLDKVNQDPDNWILKGVGEYAYEKKSRLGLDLARGYFGCHFWSRDEKTSIRIVSPYGRPGDSIWIKETWRPYSWREEDPIDIQYRADGQILPEHADGMEYKYENWVEDIWISCSDQCNAAGLKTGADEMYQWDTPEACPIKWRPAIFMPKWCSRIDLEITDIRVERLKDITAQGAIAEGLRWVSGDPLHDPVTHYMHLWDEINGKKFPPDIDPWLWVIQFKRIR